MAFSLFNRNKEESNDSPSMWTDLVSMEQWEDIVEQSDKSPQLVFKHSTRCGVSRMVLRQFESEWKGTGKCYFLDLLNHRDISNRIAADMLVEHQSPQVIVVHEGKSIYDASHQGVSATKSAELMLR